VRPADEIIKEMNVRLESLRAKTAGGRGA
jgi:hypothetical protein